MKYTKDEKTISLIVPVMNEEDAVGPFVKEVQKELENIKYKLEFLFIDDGSQDNTVINIKKLAQNDSRIRLLKLSRNFGKEAAMTAGLDYAIGDAVIPMDVDLQDPPSIIHEFIKKWEEGFDTVYGIRQSRNEDTVGKKTSAGLFYKLFNKISDTPIPHNTGDFRLIDRKVIEALKKLPEKNRFMKGLFAWPGFTSVGVVYDRPARQFGKTKFNAWRLWNFAVDGITSFSTWPLRIWSYVGVGIAIISLIFMCYIMSRTIIFGVDWPGYASLMSAILFFGAMQLISIGVLGEYMGRLYMESKNRPVYIVEDFLDINDLEGFNDD